MNVQKNHIDPLVCFDVKGTIVDCLPRDESCQLPTSVQLKNKSWEMDFLPSDTYTFIVHLRGKYSSTYVIWLFRTECSELG